MVRILQVVNKNLRTKSMIVPLKDISSQKLKKIISNMSQALAREADGVALAAPQIGVSLRLFIISAKIFTLDKKNDKKIITEDLIFINPKITRLSRKKIWLEEGCLSIRFQYGQVRRATKATVEAQDKNGQKFTWNGSGIMAQIFQHEIDHLDGILFTDKAIDVKEVKPEDIHDQQI